MGGANLRCERKPSEKKTGLMKPHDLSWLPTAEIVLKEMTVWEMVAFSLFPRFSLYIQSKENHNVALHLEI